MSAVHGLWGRFGLAARGFGLIAAGLQTRGAARTMAEPEARGPRDLGRVESLLQRHAKARGSVADVLEIARPGEAHDGWFAEGARLSRCEVVDDFRPVDMAARLRAFPDGAFDVVFSVDTIEHVRMPWKVAAEIERVLRPGGLTIHSTVFTSRYQPQPEDFFRFTPDGLKALFEGLECLTAEFDATARPRPTGRPRATGDIFGGSREGWRVTYCGRKPLVR